MKGYSIETYSFEDGDMESDFFFEAVGAMALEYWIDYDISSEDCAEFIKKARDMFLLPPVKDLSTKVGKDGGEYGYTHEEHVYLYKSKAFCILYSTLALLSDDIFKSTFSGECFTYKEFEIEPDEILYEDSNCISISRESYDKHNEYAEFEILRDPNVEKLVKLVVNM